MRDDALARAKTSGRRRAVESVSFRVCLTVFARVCLTVFARSVLGGFFRCELGLRRWRRGEGCGVAGGVLRGPGQGWEWEQGWIGVGGVASASGVVGTLGVRDQGAFPRATLRGSSSPGLGGPPQRNLPVRSSQRLGLAPWEF